jgi:hypothetical protein
MAERNSISSIAELFRQLSAKSQAHYVRAIQELREAASLSPEVREEPVSSVPQSGRFDPLAIRKQRAKYF